MTRLAIVIGLGLSGAACARVLSAEGWRVRVVDRGDGEAQRRMAATLPAGVEVVLRLEDELRRAHGRLERLERQMREEIQNVHKQYRRDLVLYQAPRPVPTRQH